MADAPRPDPPAIGPRVHLTRGQSAFLLATVFCSGCAVMVLEMTAIRVFQPFFGSSNYVWTNVIGVVMAALAVGYASGGRIADRRPSVTLLYGLLAAVGAVILAVVPLATPVSEWLVPVDLHIEGVATTLSRASLIASLILFAPPTLLLGMVSPLAVKLLSEGGVGRAAGRVFAIGTVGSLVGTYLPTYVLVPELGSRRTLQVAAAMLVVPAVIGLIAFARRRGVVAALITIIVTLPAGALANVRPARSLPTLFNDYEPELIEELESPYQYVRVREDRSPSGQIELTMMLNEGVFTYHSFMIEGRYLTDSRYYDDYIVLPLLMDVPRDEELRAAVVGLACGITVRQWKHFWDGPYRLHVDGAELDPAVVDIGRRHFGMPGDDADWLDTHVIDGRQMLVALPPERDFHMIVVDAFTQEYYIPFHVGTREFFELCRERLAPGGIIAMNVYALYADSGTLLALENTLATVFGEAVRVRRGWGGNFLLMARKDAPIEVNRLARSRVEERWGTRESVSEWDVVMRDVAGPMPRFATVVRPDPDGIVLTDDHAPLERLMDEMVDRAEREILGR